MFESQEKEICGRRVTVTELADKTKFSKGYISMVLAGKRMVTVPNLLKLADALEVDPGRLARELFRRSNAKA